MTPHQPSSPRPRRFALWLCFLLSLALSGCDVKTRYLAKEKAARAQLSIDATISADGRLVAVLDRDGMNRSRLRIKWLDRNEPWQQLPVSPHTVGVRFGLQGHELLLTRFLPHTPTTNQLLRWDLDTPQRPPRTLYEAPYLAFPVEVAPGQVLIRSCIDDHRMLCRKTGGDWLWILVEPQRQTVTPVVPPRENALFSQPSVTMPADGSPGGVFWLTDYYPYSSRGEKSRKDTPRLMAYPLPGGKPPVVNVSGLSVESQLKCDYSQQRCLRTYHSGTSRETGRYIYNVAIRHGQQACQPDGLAGWHDDRSVTPDGAAAVVGMADRSDLPRRVVILRFKPGQCHPISIQHLPLEDSPS